MKHQQLMRFGLELEAAQMNPLSYGGNNTVFYGVGGVRSTN